MLSPDRAKIPEQKAGDKSAEARPSDYAASIST
jgi:hypothetical protein